MRFPYPIQGLSENFSPGSQPPLTTRESQNVRAINPSNGRIQGAQRAGLTKYNSLAARVSPAPVKRIVSVAYDAPLHDYVDLGDSPVIEWSKSTPSRGDAKVIGLDRQSNLYVRDGNAGLVKFNSEGTQLWKLALPVSEDPQEILALAIDPDTDYVFVGVSVGGKADTAKILAYRQLDDNETDLVWEEKPGGFIVNLKVRKGRLYSLTNFPDRGRSYMSVYRRPTSAARNIEKQWPVPYPSNDFDVSPKDESVFIAHDENDQRGLDPRSPYTTQSSQSWTPYDLDNYKERIWSWHDATATDSFAIQPVHPDDPKLDGGEVVAWRCKLNTGRDWLANRGISARPPVPQAERGPIYRAEGLNGLPAVSFTGVRYEGSGDEQQAGTSMVGIQASSTDRSYRREQLSPVPTYKGAQFALCMVVKCGIDDRIRGLLSIPRSDTTSINRLRGITINRRDDNALPGTPAMTGSVYIHDWFATSSSTGANAGQSTPDAGGPSGPSAVAPGPLSGTGLAVITLIIDGGVHDTPGTATRSLFRINGMPMDRWMSPVSWFTEEAMTLGIGHLGSEDHWRFAGEVCEMVCLADWENQTGVVQRLVTAPAYPDSNWTANGDTEIERIEGYLAHKWGIAHELSTGQAAWLTFTSNPADGDTVTIGGTVYTFESGALDAANKVKIEGSVRQTAGNLYQAINRIGDPGTSYDNRTVKHATVVAMAALEHVSLNSIRMAIRSISPYSPVIALSTTGGSSSWSGATTVLQINASGGPNGWYPHPFTLKKTNSSRGGPPAVGTNTQAQISPEYLLQSVYPMLSKWDPNSGKLKWIATSGSDVIASLSGGAVVTVASGIGGVGYGVKVNSEGEIYSAGPKQATVGAPESIVADGVDLRKFGDSGSAFVTSIGGTGDPWYAILFQASDSFESTVIRMDVDSFDNLYVPIYYTVAAQPYTDVSAVGYRRASVVGVGDEFFQYAGLPDVQEAFAVLVDPLKPNLPVGDTMQHGEFFYLGVKADAADTELLSVFKLRQIQTDVVAGSVRTLVNLAVCNGYVKRFDATTMVTVTGGDPTAGGGLDPDAQYVDAAVCQGKVFFTDGKSNKVYDPKLDTLEDYKSTSSGVIPKRCKLISSWNDRIVLARQADAGHLWFMSKQGDPFNWDLFPFTFTSATAIAGNDSRTNVSPDSITCLISYDNDTMIVGMDSSIHMMTGDPADGGQFDLISDETGIAFGQAYAKDPEGHVYFFGSRGGVYVMGPRSKPRRLSQNRIERRLQNVDLTTNRIEMAWDVERDCLYVLVVPFEAGGTLLEHYTWERKTDSWHTDTYGRVVDTSVQPTCVYILDGDSPDDRVIVLGGEDGYIRYIDNTATSDDGEPIDTAVMMGPLPAPRVTHEAMFTDFDVMLTRNSGSPTWAIYASDTSDDPGFPVTQGKLVAGDNDRILSRCRGQYCWFRLNMADRHATWAFESLDLRAQPMGLSLSR